MNGAGASKRFVKTIAVTGGKGGVGKTNIVANLAIAMQRSGRKVLVLDADLGLSNIDILLHLAPKYNVKHVLSGEKQLREVLIKGPQGITILPAGSGVQELTAIDEFQRLRLIEEFDALDQDIDVLLIDTAAGISENVAFFCIAAQDIVIVTSPEPTALTDAYAVIKVLFTRYQERKFNILVNQVRSEEEAFEVFKRLSLAVEKFLSLSLDYLGSIPFDDSVRKAVRSQNPFIEMFPGCPASMQVREIASRILRSEGKVKGTLQFFIGNLLSAPGAR